MSGCFVGFWRRSPDVVAQAPTEQRRMHSHAKQLLQTCPYIAITNADLLQIVRTVGKRLLAMANRSLGNQVQVQAVARGPLEG